MCHQSDERRYAQEHKHVAGPALVPGLDGERVEGKVAALGHRVVCVAHTQGTAEPGHGVSLQAACDGMPPDHSSQARDLLQGNQGAAYSTTAR
jgi:hypothetical protein